MRQRAVHGMIVAVALGLGGCARMAPYDGTKLLAHPTMTEKEVSIGPDARVRAVSEGTTHGIGGELSCGCD